MRKPSQFVLFLFLFGCQDFNDAMNTERKPVMPPGIAPIAEMAGDPIDGVGNGNKIGPGAAAAKRSKTSIIGKTTAEVVDKQQAMAENPDLVIVDSKVSTSDPITFAARAYIAKSAQVSTFGFQRAVQTYQAEYDRYPSYDEFLRMMKENRVQFAEMPSYRMYGYEAQTGTIVILEDKALKAKIYEQAGIPVDD